MNIYPRPVNWKDFDKNIYEKNYQSEGLERINTDETEMKPGDIIFFHVMARNYIDHAGIYLGDNKFLHHQYNKLSTTESLDRWIKHIAYVIRLKD
jgi:cell wall-associated NlpC family hydrolase